MFRGVVLILCSIGLIAARAHAATVTLEKPVRISTQKSDKSRLTGRVTSYDEAGFELLRRKDQRLTVRWDELDAAGLFSVRAALIGRGTGEQWVQLGKDLAAIEGGEKLAARAFDRAIRLDPDLKATVEAARVAAKGPVTSSPAPTVVPGVKEAGAKEDGSGEADPADSGELENTGAAAGPRLVGQSDEKVWKELTEDEHAKAVAELKAFAEKTQTTLRKELALHETKFFLFYTDLSDKEAKEWARLLDRMYNRLAELFGTAKGENVWCGKALVFIFANSSDYRRFQIGMHDTDASGTAGMCHSFADGAVHIAFHRQPNRTQFAHVLVHESVHGFLHRLKGPAMVPPWANEGLAEVIAGELVSRNRRSQRVEVSAKQGLRLYSGLNGLFDLAELSPWQYPVAETLTAFMIRQDKRRYVKFILGIKEGLSWEESLDKSYNVSRERLVRAYGSSLGIEGLTE